VPVALHAPITRGGVGTVLNEAPRSGFRCCPLGRVSSDPGRCNAACEILGIVSPFYVAERKENCSPL
jgi:hypothetical protein